MVFADMGSLVSLFAQANKAPAGGGDAGGGALALICGGGGFLFMAVIFIVFIAIFWKVFSKAGQPGWASLVPIYNTWILVTEIAKKEPLWFILTLVPFVNIVASWVICQEVAKKFGKSETFGIGLFLLGPICWAILAFGSATYQGKGAVKKKYDDEDEDEEEDEEDEDERPRKRR